MAGASRRTIASNEPRHLRLIGSLPPLHVLAFDAVARESTFLRTARSMLEACGPTLALHLRLVETSTRRLYELAAETAAIARRSGGWCVVNGRPDIALSTGAQAVQLGHGAISVRAARRFADGLRIGASVHGVDEAVRAARDGANHVVLGTIYATPSHPGIEVAGPGMVRRCRAALERLPVRAGLVAIGGIDATKVARVLESGADGVAVHRAVWDSGDPVTAAVALGDLVSRRTNPGNGT